MLACFGPLFHLLVVYLSRSCGMLKMEFSRDTRVCLRLLGI